MLKRKVKLVTLEAGYFCDAEEEAGLSFLSFSPLKNSLSWVSPWGPYFMTSEQGQMCLMRYWGFFSQSEILFMSGFQQRFGYDFSSNFNSSYCRVMALSFSTWTLSIQVLCTLTCSASSHRCTGISHTPKTTEHVPRNCLEQTETFSPRNRLFPI